MTKGRIFWFNLLLVILLQAQGHAASECQPFLKLLSDPGNRYTISSHGKDRCTVELTVFDEQQDELLCTEIQNNCDSGEPDEETKARIEEFKAREMAAKAALINYEELGRAMVEEKDRRVSEHLKNFPPPPQEFERVVTDGNEHELMITVARDADFQAIERDVFSENGRFNDRCNWPESRTMCLYVPVTQSQALFEKLQNSNNVESVSFNNYTVLH